MLSSIKQSYIFRLITRKQLYRSIVYNLIKPSIRVYFMRFLKSRLPVIELQTFLIHIHRH